MFSVLFSTLILLSALVFVERIYREIKVRFSFSSLIMTKIGTFHFCFLLTLYFFFLKQLFYFWILFILSILCGCAFLFLRVKFLQHTFYGEFLRFLSLVILKMQLGCSFMAAMEQSLVGKKWKQVQLLRSIYENVAFSQQEARPTSGYFDKFIDNITKELLSVVNNQHHALFRLKALRKRLHEEQFFRRKSGQIWGYFGYQLGVLCFLYVFLIYFVCSRFPFETFKRPLFISLFFFMTGLVCLYKMAKGKKWNI